MRQMHQPFSEKNESIFTRDFFLTFIVLVGPELVGQLRQLAVVLPVLASALYVAAYPAHAFGIWKRQKLLLVIPALAIGSSLWSNYPDLSLYYGTQFAITLLIAFLLGGARNQYSVIYGVFLAYAVSVGLSALFGGFASWGAAGASAFVGLAGSKNFAGESAAMTALAAEAVMLHAWARGRHLFLVLAAAFFVVALSILMKAHASGPILAFAVGSTLLVSTYVSSRWPGYLKAVLALNLLIVGGLLYAFWDDVTATLLAVFNKDSTLTGRTYLWYRAGFIMEQNFLLGVGFNGFWVQGNPDAEALWSFAGILSRRGFNFHNTFIEVQLALGFIGMLVYFSVLALATLRTVARYLRSPTLPACFWIMILTIECMRFPFESLAFAGFTSITTLLFTALSFGVMGQAVPAGRAALTYRARRASAFAVSVVSPLVARR